MDTRPLIFCAMPHFGDVDPDAAKMFFGPEGASANIDRWAMHCQGSLLARSFNELWCLALNMKDEGVLDFTHFAMLHADVVPEAHWIDTLYGELVATGADMVHAICAFKGREGVTSTAISHATDPWDVERRLAVKEIDQLPETFSAADCGYPDRLLLPNTGCWMCPLDRPWVDKVHFEVNDRIVKHNGRRVAQTRSEDWNFGRAIAAHGGVVLATRKVKTVHGGKAYFPSHGDWGERDCDIGCEAPIAVVKHKLRRGA